MVHIWNSKGYWEGKQDDYVWDPTHGGGMDRGEGKQGGHWDGEQSGDRYREDGTQKSTSLVDINFTYYF